MKLSVSAFRAQASAQRKILSSYQNQLNYGACTTFPALGGIKVEGKPQVMVDSTGLHPSSAPKPSERPPCPESSVAAQKDSEASKTMEVKEDEKEKEATEVGASLGKREETPTLEKSPGRTRSKSNQRWMKLRTTVQLSGAITSTNQKSKPPLKREDSFLKRFSTRQIPETQETVDTGDETETLNGPQTQHEVNRRRRKRRKEMSKTVVNPDENFYFYWLMTVTVCVLYNLWTLIVRQSFPELQKAASAFWYSGDGFTDFVFVCDIFVQFRTGYLEQGLMVYNSKKLATHYLKSRAFILDTLSLVPLDFLQLNIGVNPILRFPRFLKIYRVYSYYYMVESRTVYPNLWRVVNLIHILLILAHWFGCFYYLLSEAEGFQGDWVYPYRPGDYATLTRKYLGSLYWSTLTLTTIGDLPTPETNAESRGRSKAMTASGQSQGIPRRGHKSRLLQFNSNYGYLFTIISYLIGVFIFATIVGQVGNVITNRNANRLEFERLLDGAKTYMRHHKVPGGMKRRVLRWYDYSWSRGRIQGGGDINTALGLLPDKLKTELALHVNLSVLKKVTIFQECQPEFLHDLVLKMKAYIFTPGDLICRKGEVAREMFIIADGILDVISETGRVLTTMKAGDFFGEIGILNLDGLNKRTADVRSVGYSELFSLSREDVLAAMKDYPEAQEILQSLGRKRLMEAKNASKMYKAQVKQAKDHDSSGDSDTAGKRIVEKLRSDVKGLKYALRRSRRGTRTKDMIEGGMESLGGKTSNNKQSILRRMSHVQSSDEYEGNNEIEQSPIGAGLPLLQRLKMLKEKQEKERGEEKSKSFVSGNQTKKDGNSDAETGLPFTQKLKLLKQKETKETVASGSSVVSSTVRTQVTGIRFDKATSKAKNLTSPKEVEEKEFQTKSNEEATASDSKKKDPTESGKISLKERLKMVHPSQVKEKILPSGTSSSSNLDTQPETSINVPLAREAENSVPKLLENKFEVPKSKDAWNLLKKSSITCSKQKYEEKKLVRKVSKKGTYLSKSDTVLEKQTTVEKDEEKRSRSISPSDNSKPDKKTLKRTVEELMSERKRSKSVGHSPKVKEDDVNYWEFPNSCNMTDGPRQKEENSARNRQKIKKYNSISDLSPEYSGLPFVKKLKILNERQKLEELEKELIVRSSSLDVPERPTATRGNVLVRSQSEASTIEFKKAENLNLQAEIEARRQHKTPLVSTNETLRNNAEPYPECRKVISEEKKSEARNHSESSIASPESNETLERRQLKSILKKLSAEDSTSDEDQTSRNLGKDVTSKKEDNTELKKLMRAPTIEGYAARHKKLTKSVTFDSDTLPSSPDAALEQPLDEHKGKGFAPMSPTAILTLQLSNLSMIPIASPKKTEKKEEKLKIAEDKNTDKERPDKETGKMDNFQDEGHKLKKLEREKENPSMPYALHELIETNFRMLPFTKNLDDEFSTEIKGEILQVLQLLLEEVHKKFESQFSNLRTEVKRRDEIILQLRSKIRELEVKNVTLLEHKSRTEIFERNADSSGTDPDVLDIPFLRGDSFETIRGVCSPSPESLSIFMSRRGSPAGAENSSKTTEASSQAADFRYDSFDYLGNVISYEEEDSVETKDEVCLLPTPTDTALAFLRRGLRRPLDPPSDEDMELAELPSPFRSDDFKRKRHRSEFQLKRNFSVDETRMVTTSKIGEETVRSNDRRKPVETRSKANFIHRVAELQRSFSCSQEKTSDFVTLDIDDSSNSSDVENLHNKDWEVQMLVEEMAKKDPYWEIKEEWSSKGEAEVDDVKRLQEEVNTLKQMVCDSDLTRLTTSELDILETIIEAKDQKISQIAKSNSLDDDDNHNRLKRQMHICSSGSDNRLKRNEQRKKPSLRQKIGQAFSFDFHDIDSRKSKSPDFTKHRAFYLRKQKTVSGSNREHQSLYNLWHTSSQLRNRVLEDSDRVMKSLIIGDSKKASSGSSLPVLIQSSLPRDKTCDVRTSLPLLSAKELPERLTSSISSSEEIHQDFKQSCDSVFEESELPQDSVREEMQTFSSPSTSGVARPNECHPSSSLNSFIKSVGQRVKQVMAGDANTIRNQVPTISKLCDDQLILKDSEMAVSEDFGGVSGVPSEEDSRPVDSEPSKILDSFDPDHKTDPPDL